MELNFVLHDVDDSFQKGDCAHCPIKEQYGYVGYTFTLGCFDISKGCPLELRYTNDIKMP